MSKNHANVLCLLRSQKNPLVYMVMTESKRDENFACINYNSEIGRTVPFVFSYLLLLWIVVRQKYVNKLADRALESTYTHKKTIRRVTWIDFKWTHFNRDTFAAPQTDLNNFCSVENLSVYSVRLATKVLCRVLSSLMTESRLNDIVASRLLKTCSSVHFHKSRYCFW